MVRRGRYPKGYWDEVFRDHSNTGDQAYCKLKHFEHCSLQNYYGGLPAFKLGAQLGINECMIHIKETGDWIMFSKYYEHYFITWTNASLHFNLNLTIFNIDKLETLSYE